MAAQIVSTSTGAIAIDYSVYYERIATALETIVTISSSTNVQITAIAAALTTVSNLSTTTGIRVLAPYDWSPGIDIYDWYINQANTLSTSSYTSTEFTSLMQSISSVIGALPRFT